MRTSDSKHTLPIAPNLLARDFSESAPNTLKQEWIHRARLQRRDRTRTLVFEHLEAYRSRKRRYSTHGFLSPMDYAQWNFGATSQM